MIRIEKKIETNKTCTIVGLSAVSIGALIFLKVFGPTSEGELLLPKAYLGAIMIPAGIIMAFISAVEWRDNIASKNSILKKVQVGPEIYSMQANRSTAYGISIRIRF